MCLLEIHYGSRNYRGCWHQTCPPIDTHQHVWNEFKALRARKKEREREREKERKRPGKGEGSRPGQRKEEKKKKKKQDMIRHALLPRTAGVLATKAKEAKKRTRAGPKRKKGEEEGGRGERRKTEPETAATESRERRKNKNSRIQISKSIQKRAPGTNENTPRTQHGVRCKKLSGETRRNKNRTPKKQG